MSQFTLKDQILFAKRLSFLMRAGVPLFEALNLIKSQIKSPKSLKIIKEITIQISAGLFLASALEKTKNSFSNFAINIIRVGEESGNLAENLNYLALELKKKDQLKKKIMSAMFYPAFIATATIALTLVLTLVVFPKVLPIFSGMKISLPLSTKILIFVSNFLMHQFWWVVFATIIAAVLIYRLYKNKQIKFTVHLYILKLPIMGSLLKNYFLANFCRTFGLLLKSELTIDSAINIAAEAMDNLAYQKVLLKLGQEIKRGTTASQFLSGHQTLFPELLSQMILIGETSGNLSETLLYMAELYESQVEELTKNLSSLMEPVLMVGMGLLVGFVAVSIITPIYSLTTKLNP